MLKKIIFLTLAMLLAACVSVPHMAELDQKPIVYSGRFSISYQHEGATLREQGGFEWKIQNTVDPIKAMQLALLSPLGSTMALIAFNPQAEPSKRASLTSPAQIDFAPDLDTLMQELLGWRLPLAELLPWLANTTPNRMPADWSIAVLNRHDSGFPKLITANNDAQRLSVRLVFDAP
jgi:outer membrane lipoprotein LolB